MADYSPTIIAASLDDNELKTSIDKLVKYVGDQSLKMAQEFDAGVQLMKESLKTLGNIKQVDSNSRVNSHNDAAKAIERETNALDNLAKATSRATGRKELKNDFVQLDSDIDKQWSYIIDLNKDVDAQLQHMIEHEQKLIQEKEREAQVTREIQEARDTRVGVSGKSLGWEDVNTAGKKAREMASGAKEVNYLRQQVASLLEVEEREIRVANTSTSSYSQLNQYVKQLQASYQRLGADRIAKGEGTDIANEIQKVQRAMAQLNAQMSRPINWDAVKNLPIQTLDDIAYKIQMLQRYRSGLNVETQTKEIKDVNNEINELNKKQNHLINTNKSLLESNNALARSWNYMKNRLAFYFTVGASTAFVRNLIEVRSQYEMNEKALGILINSAERGSQIFKELSEMALVSPYTLIELSSATKQLVAYGIAAKDAVDTTRRLADMAAAVGIPMERLTYALGQIKAYGYLNSRDQRMFANAGIPLVKQLADYYTELEGKIVSTGDVYDRIKKKAVDYNDVMQVVNRMTDEGGKFFNFQAKMADTLKVQLANLTLAWNNMLNDIGSSNQGVISSGIKGLKSLFLEWKNINSVITSAIGAGGLVVFVRALNVALVKVGYQWRFLSKEMTAAGIAGASAAQKASTLGGTLSSLAKSSLTWWSLLAFAIVDVGKAIYYSNEAQETLNKSIREGAKDNYKNVSDFLNEYQKLRNSLYKTTTDAAGNSIVSTQDIDKSDAGKAWEAMQEQIELTTRNSDEYIGSLLRIENVSDRLRAGFSILEDIQEVSAALSQLDDNTIKVSTDWSKWWNGWTLPDGLIGNLKDFVDVSQKYNRAVELFGKDAELQYLTQHYERELDALNKDIKKTTDSLLDFITLKGWQGDVNKINEVFSQAFNKIALDNSLTPQYAFELQLRAEEARSKAAKDGVRIRIEDEKAALKQEADEIARAEIKARLEALQQEYNDFEKWNGASRVYWSDFTKWMKEQHISEMTAMFRGMDAQQIQSLDFEKGKYFEWVNELVTKYAKEHKLSYDDAFNYLKNWVTSANQWSIFIPLTISTDDNKSIYETLTEADSAADAAYKKMQRLKERKEQLEKKGGSMSGDASVAKEYLKVTEEITNAQKDYNDALAKGGHSAKESKNGAKERKAAESELQKALKDELSLIDKVRNDYKKLTKDGINSVTALNTATSGFDETLSYINAVLGKYGVGKLDLTKYAGVSNPTAIMTLLQSQLDALQNSSLVKPAEIKDLQVKLKDLKIESLTFNQETLIKSLDNELGKIKDEYEIAVELDASPELGSAFAEAFDLEISGYPHTIEDAISRAQSAINKALGEAGYSGFFDILKGDTEELRDSMGQSIDSNLIAAVEKAQKEIRSLWKKYEKETISEWDKLLEKYGEYEYKRKKIIEDAEREIALARKKGNSDIENAANIRKQRELAKLDFEQFQQTPTWIAATGDLATLTSGAIGMLIDKLEEYKKSAKNLDPKQIKQINNALKQLYRQQRQNNPFAFIVNAIDDAKDRANDYQIQIDAAEARLTELNKKKEKGIGLTKAEEREYSKLCLSITQWREEMEEVGKVSATSIVKGLQDMLSSINQITGSIGEMFAAFGDEEAQKNIQKVTSTLEKGLSFASMGASIGGKSAGGWGAAIGGVVGLLVGGLTAWADEISGNAAITKQVEESERVIKGLEVSYKNLQKAIDDAYGTAAMGAQRAALENKKLQLQELERQLELERSRSAKRKDEDKIISLTGQIEDLKNEISDLSNEIVNSFLGISSVGDAVENFVGIIVDALRDGEDAMSAFSSSVDDMIANMLKKFVSSKMIGPLIENVMEDVSERIEERAQNATVGEAIGTRSKTKIVDKISEYEALYANALANANTDLAEYYKSNINYYKALLEAVGTPNFEDVEYLGQQLTDLIPILQPIIDQIDEMVIRLGLKKSDSTTEKLSNLQQGIQGITEDTAGALEAYMNGVSQQVYLHSMLLTEIRDAILGFNMDVQLGVQSQILLELQNSYQVQMAIQGILQGWSSANGLAVRVEMV